MEGFAGLRGDRQDLSVDALVGRTPSNLTYQTFNGIEEVAALYAEVISKEHVFNDVNKRTALISMRTFLGLNGYQVVADQTAIADKMVEISGGKIGHRQFAMWLKPKTRACR